MALALHQQEQAFDQQAVLEHWCPDDVLLQLFSACHVDPVAPRLDHIEVRPGARYNRLQWSVSLSISRCKPAYTMYYNAVIKF